MRILEVAAGTSIVTRLLRASFNTVGCQFGVMFFPDKNAGHREAQRIIRKRRRVSADAAL